MTHTQTVMLRLLTMCIPFRNLRKKWRTFLRDFLSDYDRDARRSMRAWRRHPVAGRTILILEPNYCHGEVIPGFCRHLLDMGYRVDVLMHHSLARQSPLCCFKEGDIHIFTAMCTSWKRLAKARVLTRYEAIDTELETMVNELTAKVTADMDSLTIPQALMEIFAVIQRANKYIDETAPWALAKDEANKARLESVLYHLCEALRVCGILLNAYLPTTAPKMMEQLGLDASALDLAKTTYGAQETYTVHKGEALFPRIDVAKEIAHLKEEDEKRKAAAEAANKAKAEAEKKAAAPAEESTVDFTHEEEIDFDTFCKVELRVAEVRACENLKESKKLLHLTVFDGERERCILSGIAKWFKPEDLIGKKIGIVCNLAPRPMMKGKYVSEGMIFAADTADGGCSIAFYGDDTPVGSRIH